MTRRFAPRIAMAMLVLAIMGCGQAEPAASGPTVAERRLGGSFRLDGLTVEGTPIDLVDPVQVDIEAEFGELRIDTACGILLGSFSLESDGRAGFTVAGGSTRTCTPAERGQQEQLIAALGRVTSWTESDPGLVLESEQNDQVVLAR